MRTMIKANFIFPDNVYPDDFLEIVNQGLAKSSYIYKTSVYDPEQMKEVEANIEVKDFELVRIDSFQKGANFELRKKESK